MYVTDGTEDTGSDTTTGTDHHDELSVEVNGEDYSITENYDYDGDGDNDAAVVQTDDGYMAFSDTDGDGTADQMVQLDSDGNVIAAAEFDSSSHEWTEEDPNSAPAPHGDGADDHSSTSGHTTHTPSGHSSSGSDTEAISVDTPDGEMTAGEATYDSDGDGTNDTAVVTDNDGNTYAFTDTDGDGQADQAVVIDNSGDVTIAQHSGDHEWTTVETGHIDTDGNFEPDSGSDSGHSTAGAGAGASGGAAGSDSAWTSA